MPSCWYAFQSAFFAISGANKLFVAGGTKPVYETLVKAKVPFPHLTAYFVSAVEFVAGSLLTVGFLSTPACVALLVDMTVAVLTSALSTITKGLSPLVLSIPTAPTKTSLILLSFHTCTSQNKHIQA